VKLGEHIANTGEDGVVLPALAVITDSVVAGHGGAIFVGCVGEKCDGPLFDRRANETVQRALVAHVAGVDDLAETAENAGLGVGEGSVEVEDEGRQGMGHDSSFAE
jgi:hypothetical protein